MIKIGSEFKYPLSRACLKNGILTMPYSMQGLFPEEGEVLARDSQTSDEYTIRIIGNRRVEGFKDFIESHDLIVNDNIVILLDDDGSYSLRAEKAVRTVKKAYKSRDLGTILDDLYKLGVARSEPEICARYDLRETAALHRALSEDNRFIYQSGRWQIINDLKSDTGSIKVRIGSETEENSSQQISEKIAKTSHETLGESSNSHNNIKELFRGLGYSLAVIDQEKMSIKINLGRRQYGVLIHIMSESSSLDWTDLINQRRNLGLDYVAIFADHRDLIRLVSPAKSARISLWSWRAFDRLVDYSKIVAISPFDLEPHFAIEGLYEKGFDKFEQKIHEIIATRGRFSAVLESLAAMKVSTVFVLDDVQVEDCSRADILKVLDLLEQSPFQIVQKIAPAEFFLRKPVLDALDGFAHYSMSLKTRLSKRKSYHVTQASEEEHSDSLQSI